MLRGIFSIKYPKKAVLKERRLLFLANCTSLSSSREE
jgi:hypothetical protein